MQERIERCLTYWLAKPISWAILGILVAIRYGWLGTRWCVNRLREKWTAWWAKRKSDDTPVVQAGLTIAGPTTRAHRREAATKR